MESLIYLFKEKKKAQQVLDKAYINLRADEAKLVTSTFKILLTALTTCLVVDIWLAGMILKI